MLTLTFAGDEAGAVSFAFDKGASHYFVVAAIGATRPDELRQRLADIRQRSKLPADFEFKFNTLSAAALRQRTLDSLAHADFESWAVVVDKPALPDTFRVMRRLDFYVYFLTELIRLIPLEKREGATLILDEYISADSLRTELRRFMNARHIPRHFNRVLVKRSRSESLIQVADLVAGALLKRDARTDVEAYDYLADKIKQVLEVRG